MKYHVIKDSTGKIVAIYNASLFDGREVEAATFEINAGDATESYTFELNRHALNVAEEIKNGAL